MTRLNYVGEQVHMAKDAGAPPYERVPNISQYKFNNLLAYNGLFSRRQIFAVLSKKNLGIIFRGI